MLERGVLDVPVAATLPLSQAADAHRMVEAGDRRGAVILTID
jgi:NADPH:quinone reductase-like Zn-dependent oxidoreductase